MGLEREPLKMSAPGEGNRSWRAPDLSDARRVQET
jgi:hypothetical protein